MESRYRISRDRHNGHYPSPSFSSTLLDSIYRSFDDSAHGSSRPSLQQEEALLFREMAVKSNANCPDRSERRSRGDCRRSRDQIVDCWMELGDSQRSIRQEMAMGVYANMGDRHRPRGSMKMPSSSDSSSLGGFSSSDTDSMYGVKKKNKSLKPIRTSLSNHSDTKTFRSTTTQSESFSDDLLYRKSRSSDDKPAKSDGGRSTAKSRARRFYGDLKRMKQPISPGGKLATFLSSLFSSNGTAKKQRISTSTPATAAGDRCNYGRWERSESKSNYTPASTPTCSTASSYSRSCLGKTPSSAGAKRSVRFSPVSVVIHDENLSPAKDVRSSNSKFGIMGGGSTITLDQELKFRAMEKNRRVEEAAMELLKNYNMKWESSAAKEAEMVGEDYQGEDAESCCSSDLFELENLLQIGVDRYCAELPVYETTRVDTNRAIARGLIV